MVKRMTENSQDSSETTSESIGLGFWDIQKTRNARILVLRIPKYGTPPLPRFTGTPYRSLLQPCQPLTKKKLNAISCTLQTLLEKINLERAERVASEASQGFGV